MLSITVNQGVRLVNFLEDFKILSQRLILTSGIRRQAWMDQPAEIGPFRCRDIEITLLCIARMPNVTAR